jgi:hypothetical protein
MNVAQSPVENRFHTTKSRSGLHAACFALWLSVLFEVKQTKSWRWSLSEERIIRIAADF